MRSLSDNQSNEPYKEREHPEIDRRIDRPEILKSEMISSLAKLNKNKAVGPAGIVVEILVTLYDFSIYKTREIMNEI